MRANDLIDEAASLATIKSAGDRLPPENRALARIVLNTLTDEIAADPSEAHASELLTATLPANTATRTIGPSGDFDASPQPMRIEDGAFFTRDGQDYPIASKTEAEYNRLAIKTFASYGPSIYWYRPSIPGLVTFYPVPSTAVVVSLPVLVTLDVFPDLTTDVTLPRGYRSFLVYALAMRLCLHFDKPVPKFLAILAANAERVLAGNNLIVPQLQVNLGPIRRSILTDDER